MVESESDGGMISSLEVPFSPMPPISRPYQLRALHHDQLPGRLFAAPRGLPRLPLLLNRPWKWQASRRLQWVCQPEEGLKKRRKLQAINIFLWNLACFSLEYLRGAGRVLKEKLAYLDTPVKSTLIFHSTASPGLKFFSISSAICCAHCSKSSTSTGALTC